MSLIVVVVRLRDVWQAIVLELAGKGWKGLTGVRHERMPERTGAVRPACYARDDTEH